MTPQEIAEHAQRVCEDGLKNPHKTHAAVAKDVYEAVKADVESYERGNRHPVGWASHVNS